MKYIRFMGHLSYGDLLSYLLIPNAVLFSEFGELNTTISGVSRDALSLGTLLVSSAQDHESKAQYGAVAPRLFALSQSDIAETMQMLLGISEHAFNELKLRVHEFSEAHMSPKHYFFNIFEKLHQISNYSSTSLLPMNATYE